MPQTFALDERICRLCPLGPEPLTVRFCQRCVADIAGVVARRALSVELAPRYIYDGLDYSRALEYDLLTSLLVDGDPAEGTDITAGGERGPDARTVEARA